MGNQHFTINKIFRYDIWCEQTNIVASDIHFKKMIMLISPFFSHTVQLQSTP